MRLGEITVDFEPLGRRADVAPGTTLLEAARQAGVGLNAVCGGGGTCGMCRVRVVSGDVSPPTESEREAAAEGFRLACQARALGDVRVDVPPDSITAPQRAQVEGRERTADLSPTVRVYDVTLPAPSLDDLRADGKRLRDALEAQHSVGVARFDPVVLRHLPLAARENGWRIRIVIKGSEGTALLPASSPPLGLAVDIGTTKMAGYLVDLENGERLAAAGRMNPQIAYGEDVMARIAYAMEGPAQAQALQEVLVAGLNELAGELCVGVGIEPGAIVDVVLVGNTCMHHLALGLPVAQLGVAPYVAAVADAYDLKARDLGLGVAPGANVHLLPNIAGFVGADHVSMLLATGIGETDETIVGLDIGTNTEISLAVGDRLLCCSCASGPAFEGAHIRDGMRAAPGAIERVRLGDGAPAAPGAIEYQAIDDAPPVGFCGSGILDAVAELWRTGVLQPSGAMQPGSHPRVRGEGKATEFLLVPKGERGAVRDLAITRGDVNEIQLAKAAIRAGVEVLLEEAGVTADQVERVVVAGAFGTYLDIDSALAVGMFPPLPRERFDQVGNAAGIGAKLVLLSTDFRRRAVELARRLEYVELTTHPRFTPIYVDALGFTKE